MQRVDFIQGQAPYVRVCSEKELLKLPTYNNLLGVLISYEPESLPEWFYDLKLERLLTERYRSPLKLSPSIGHMTSLRWLTISTNMLEEIPPEIGKCTNLEYINVSGNNLTAIPPEIGLLTKLRTLKMSINYITAIPPEIGKLRNLVYLELYTNSYTTVPEELWNLTNLQYLLLGSVDARLLFPGVTRLPKLKWFYTDIDSYVDVPEVEKK